MNFTPFTPARLSRRIFGQLWMLALQFLLGMALNLVGDETKGASHAFYVVILVLHILNAIGLVEGNIYIALKAPGKLAWWTAGVGAATLSAGWLTVQSGSDLWSFVMAAGFLASAWLNGLMYVRSRTAAKPMD